MLIFLFTIEANAIPFSADLIRSDDKIAINSQSFSVGNGVVLSSNSPDLNWQHLGGPFYRIPTDSPREAMQLSLQLQHSERGQFIWPDIQWEQKSHQFNDPLFNGQWYFEFLEMTSLHSESLGDPSINLAVIDSGIDIAHPDLLQHIGPYDTHDDDIDPTPNPGEYCGGGTTICDEHGTAVSGIMLATANNDAGMVGLCPECTLIPIKMLGEGSGSLSADIAAFEHAIAMDAAVINNSWGYVTPTQVPDALSESIRRAQTIPRAGLGALVVFAAGNDDREIVDGELCTLPDILCISAIDSYGRPTAYTNYGDAIDIAAPSATVSIAPNNNTTVTFGGTSAAAPVVSGLAGWALSVSPNLSASELHDILIASAAPSPLVTHDSNGHHPDYGYGVISTEKLYTQMVANPPDPDNQSNKTGCSSLPVLPFMIFPLLWGMIPSSFHHSRKKS